jgi:hypothetical protein
MRADHGSSTTSTRETRAHAECDEDDVDRSNGGIKANQDMC